MLDTSCESVTMSKEGFGFTLTWDITRIFDFNQCPCGVLTCLLEDENRGVKPEVSNRERTVLGSHAKCCASIEVF